MKLHLTEAQMRRINQLVALERDLSQNDIARAIADALVAAYPEAWYYLVDVYVDYAIYLDWETEKYFKVSYTVDSESGVATIGTPAEVLRVITYEPVPSPATETAPPPGSELVQGDCVRLLEGQATEAAFQETGKLRICVIQPGWGSSGFYSAEVLKRDGAAAFPAGTKMFWNHPTREDLKRRPERDLDCLAGGFLSAAEWDENGPLGPALYADVEVQSKYRGTIADIGQYFGDSIYCLAKFEAGEAEGRSGQIVSALLPDRFNTVDWVTYPGAGGEIVALYESAAPPAAPEPPQPNPQEGKETMTPEEKAALEAAQAEASKLAAENARLRLYPAARAAAAAALEGITMPAITREQVIEACAQAPVLTESGEIDAAKFAEAVKAAGEKAVKYLTEATGYDPAKAGTAPAPRAAGASPVHHAGGSSTQRSAEGAKPIAGARQALGLI